MHLNLKYYKAIYSKLYKEYKFENIENNIVLTHLKRARDAVRFKL